ncbi:uncharacterized protein BT62DRAFT_1011107 [Guyanagaster necrorhizus]|uniref:Uncharacterized protein n=1 Tax=Guyanagaster necrorhizus TaxID=856835 RepID=A0A9P7VKY4_9AGAR|nr:uncharacterized protein BT62DRAFT_1011107 [Guyanagaster necrorhizus MCA 3950]KAG7441809.1 hypothetical protein BT62DRAFT_1011107 [Guyanagaster necrorhizus MCA 3950]
MSSPLIDDIFEALHVCSAEATVQRPDRPGLLLSCKPVKSRKKRTFCCPAVPGSIALDVRNIATSLSGKGSAKPIRMKRPYLLWTFEAYSRFIIPDPRKRLPSSDVSVVASTNRRSIITSWTHMPVVYLPPSGKIFNLRSTLAAVAPSFRLCRDGCFYCSEWQAGPDLSNVISDVSRFDEHGSLWTHSDVVGA